MKIGSMILHGDNLEGSELPCAFVELTLQDSDGKPFVRATVLSPEDKQQPIDIPLTHDCYVETAHPQATPVAAAALAVMNLSEILCGQADDEQCHTMLLQAIDLMCGDLA